MRDLLRRFTLERAIQLAVVATVVSAVLASGSILAWVGPARKLRWAALLTLAVLAVVYALRRTGVPRPGSTNVVAACFVALALVSVWWSPFPRLTAGRSIAFGVLLVACAALAAGAAGRPEAVERIVGAVAAAAAVVAVGGLLVLAGDYDRAVQPASTSLAARYQGLGGGPNTATMLLAVAVPLSAYPLTLSSRQARLAGAALLALLLGSIVASGSRGALLAGFGGLVVFTLLVVRDRRRRVAAAVLVAACLVVAALVMRIPQPAEEGAAPLSATPSTETVVDFEPADGYLDANEVLRLQDDVGRPPFGVADTTPRPRELTGSSGRTEAWVGALDQAADRPLAGYAFGTEDQVFTERYAGFNSNVPENSYVGLALQLGVLGLIAFAGLVLALVLPAVRALPRLGTRELRLAAACLGTLAAGLVLACFQSYIYAAGNNATAAVWICTFMLAAIGTAHASSQRI